MNQDIECDRDQIIDPNVINSVNKIKKVEYNCEKEVSNPKTSN